MGQNYDDKRIREIEKAIGDVTNLENESIAEAIGDMALMDGSSITDAIGDMSMLEGSTIVDKILSGGGGGGTSFTKYTGTSSVSFPASTDKIYDVRLKCNGSSPGFYTGIVGFLKQPWESAYSPKSLIFGKDASATGEATFSHSVQFDNNELTIVATFGVDSMELYVQELG